MQDDRLRTSLPHALVRTFRLVNRAHNRAFKDLGISAEQAHVLSCLWLEGPMTIGQLQRMLALSSPTLTGAIDRMEAQNLLRRVPDPKDRRSWVLEPDPSVNRKRKKIEETIFDVEDRCFAALTVAERRELLRLLEKCTAALEA
jgi:DNA-binding MarR family transcriptional regulator